MNTQNNAALLALASVWSLDGDLMRCRGCGRALIASREGEPLTHVSGCRFEARTHPWTELRSALSKPITDIPDIAKSLREASAYLREEADFPYRIVPIEPTQEQYGRYAGRFATFGQFCENYRDIMACASPSPVSLEEIVEEFSRLVCGAYHEGFGKGMQFEPGKPQPWEKSTVHDELNSLLHRLKGEANG